MSWIHPSRLMSMSPEVEVTNKLGTTSFSPLPSIEDEMDNVLLKVLSDGRKQLRSESVMLDDWMLPR